MGKREKCSKDYYVPSKNVAAHRRDESLNWNFFWQSLDPYLTRQNCDSSNVQNIHNDKNQSIVDRCAIGLKIDARISVPRIILNPYAQKNSPGTYKHAHSLLLGNISFS